MPVHHFARLQGRIETLTIQSEALGNNILGDPTKRDVAVYLPPGYDESNQDYPVMVDIVGYTGSGFSHLNWRAFGESVPIRIERLIGEGAMGPVIVLFPDCFTSLGGNQYINSPVLGNWADFLIHEMLPRAEERYRIKPGCRAVFGKSSGGYGAIIHGMKYAGVWQAVACHSGDMDFDFAYRTDFPKILDRLGEFGHHIPSFFEHLDQTRKLVEKDMLCLLTLFLAASYDPEPDAYKGIRLPVDLRTGQLNEERWARWLAHDPIVLARQAECQAALGELKGLFIDCGFRDQYRLHYGSRRLSNILDEAGINHVYEEFDDNHSDIDYRMDRSLPFLYEALS